MSRRWFVVHEKGLLVRREGESWALPSEEEFASFGIAPHDTHALGALDDAEAYAAAAGVVPEGFEPVGLRVLASLFDPTTFQVAGRALHVVDWATTSRYCGRCGTRTELADKDRAMKCPNCGLTAYPRIAPAIIVLVRKGDQALLARNARFPGAFYSTLAGFAEIGETLEETLSREVREEVGVTVKNIRYFGSQPWPFPHSLMIGFEAEWDYGEIDVDGDEIADAQWFDADNLPNIPPRLSIARRLIDAWVADVHSRR
jgi:NAD+ diphosphatase